jgi:hypothetical protein
LSIDALGVVAVSAAPHVLIERRAVRWTMVGADAARDEILTLTHSASAIIVLRIAPRRQQSECQDESSTANPRRSQHEYSIPF